MGFFKWIDRNLWSVPVGVFVGIGLGFGLWDAVGSRPVLLAAAPPASRQAAYSSMTSTASAFFGAVLAVVAILVVFPRLTDTKVEAALALARTRVVGILLTTSWFMVMVVIIGSIAVTVDLRPVGNVLIVTLIEASAIASIVGMIVSGLGLVLVIVERSRK